MQRNAIIIAAIVAVAAVAICLIGAVVVLQVTGRPSTEPTLAPPPSLEPLSTPTPGGAADDSWERIQAAGRIVIGTSADYPPFEYMTEQDQVDGFDVQLMNAIGRNLDVSISWQNLAFDGLVDAVRAGQIDAAIAGISITDERQALVDFSNIYHSGEDAFLANDSSPLEGIDEAGDLSTLRVGAQRGTVHESYLQGLVDQGLLPQVFRYEAATDAVRDLRQDRLDLVMLDALPAQAFVEEDGVKIVGLGLNRQQYAIALPKGATSLRDQINSAIADLDNQGVTAQLNKQYLNLDPEDILPTPTPTPLPAETNTPAPPPPCSKVLTLVKHVSYDDKNGSAPPVLSPGEAFTKTWRVRNDGSCTWDSSYTLVFASGGRMDGQPVAVQGQVEPGATYDVSVNLVAPNKGGSHKGFWQMEDSSGTAFGEMLPVRIWVASPATPTPAPTPVPGISFNVDRRDIEAGEPVYFSWNVQNVQNVYFYPEGQDPQGVKGVVQNYQVYPPSTLTYHLRVQFHDGSFHEATPITINVRGASPPQIVRFHLHPHDHLNPDGTVTLEWEVQGRVDTVNIYRDDQVIRPNAPTSDSMRELVPVFPGNQGYTYKIQAIGPGGEKWDQRELKLSGGLPPTPTDTPPPPPPEDPVIDFFSATPDSVPRGDPVTLQWQTSGGTSQVKIVSGDRVVASVDELPPSGTWQDHPPEQEGEVPYRLIAYNTEGKHNHQVVTITIIPPLE